MKNLILFLVIGICQFCFLVVCGQELPEQYREEFVKSVQYRLEQFYEVDEYANKLLEAQNTKALNCFQPDFSSIENYKMSLQPYRQMIMDFYSYPPPLSKEGEITKIIDVGEDKYCHIKRVWIEVIEGVNAYGILMVPKKIKNKAPLLIAVHGGGGNPEAICDLDTRENYKSFGHLAVKEGYVVWAPGQVMFSPYAGDPDTIDRGQLDRKLRLSGNRMIGVDFQKIIEGTKTLIREYPEIDSERIGMTGLSFGGFFTLHVSAIWPRIIVAASSGTFRNQEDYLNKSISDEKITYWRHSNTLGYAQVIGLICPRPCFSQLGYKDPLYSMEPAKKEAKKAKQYYKKLGIEEKFEFVPHNGGHVYYPDDVFEFFRKYLFKK